MVMVPPVILVFDISALSAASSLEWREFSRVGNCYIPQVVYEEVKRLIDRAPDSDLERMARAFHQFYGASGWQVSEANAYHTALTSDAGLPPTRRTTLSLAVGRCAYGMAQEFSNSLVVLVSKDRSLLQRLYEISRFNLCGITGESLLQWSRSGQRPIPVSQTFQQFRAKHRLQPHHSSVSSTFEPSALSVYPIAHTTLLSAAAVRPASARSRLLFNRSTEWLVAGKSLLVALVSFAIVTYLVWLLFNATGWNTLLQHPSNPQSLRHLMKAQLVLGELPHPDAQEADRERVEGKRLQQISNSTAIGGVI
jgi:hypothetical protein